MIICCLTRLSILHFERVEKFTYNLSMAICYKMVFDFCLLFIH